MTFKVIRTSPIQLDYDENELEALGVKSILRPCQSEEELIASAHDADAVIALLARQPFGRNVLKRLERCRVIVTPSIGYECIDVEAATEQGICVVNVPDFCLEEVSDHAMALLLACARKLLPLNQAVRDGKWDSASRPRIMEMWQHIPRLRGKTLGLIGFGNISRVLTPKAQGFGLNLITCDPNIAASTAESLGVELVELDHLLSESDFISIHAPLVHGTRHMLGIEEFKRMKPTAYIINTARGAIINEPDLCTALSKGYIAGAGLDVTDPEPPEADSQLVHLDNVIITAHSAAASDTALAELQSRPMQEVLRLLRGQWPYGLVNPKVKGKFAQKWSRATIQNKEK